VARGYGIGSIGPNPWASANAAQYLGPGAQFQTLAGAPGSAGQYWASQSLAARRSDKFTRPTKANIESRRITQEALSRGAIMGSASKPPPKGTSQQPRNPVVPAGDSAPYKGSEAPIAAPSKGGTLRIGGMNVWSGPNKPTTPVQRITVPQDATQTRQQVKAGRKQIKLPGPEALAAIGGAGLLLVLL